MPKRSTRYQAMTEKLPGDKQPVELDKGIELVKNMAEVTVNKKYKGGKKRKGFDQTIELIMKLGIDPKQADQMIRGAVSLPKGIGKSKRVVAFCEDDLAEQAKEAGAIEAGADELVQKIQDGWMDFDVAVAHPRLMGKVGKLGRILGPQGKMPSPKAGTVTPDIATAVKEYGAGKLEFRNDSGGNIHAVVGKASFSTEDLKTNIEAFVSHIRKLRPSSAKGTFVQNVALCGTMTPAVQIAI
jgi:large subunit ribosomal protein L1